MKLHPSISSHGPRPPRLKRNNTCALAAILLAALLTPSRLDAQNTNAPAQTRTDYSSFRLIADRNIFNTTRSGRAAPTRRETRRTARVDTITLVGILDSKLGAIAFFDSTTSDYKKAAKVGDTLADFKVAEIGSAHVTLAKGDQRININMGSPLRREEGGAWQDTTPDITRDAPASTARPTNATESAAPDEDDDVIKRLMQKREKENR